jgi:hypothetical protein
MSGSYFNIAAGAVRIPQVIGDEAGARIRAASVLIKNGIALSVADNAFSEACPHVRTASSKVES